MSRYSYTCAPEKLTVLIYDHSRKIDNWQKRAVDKMRRGARLFLLARSLNTLREIRFSFPAGCAPSLPLAI